MVPSINKREMRLSSARSIVVWTRTIWKRLLLMGNNFLWKRTQGFSNQVLDGFFIVVVVALQNDFHKKQIIFLTSFF